MHANVGTADSIIRVWLGIAIVAASGLVPSLRNVAGVAGAILVLTAIFRFCPFYLPFRFHT